MRGFAFRRSVAHVGLAQDDPAGRWYAPGRETLQAPVTSSGSGNSAMGHSSHLPGRWTLDQDKAYIQASHQVGKNRDIRVTAATCNP